MSNKLHALKVLEKKQRASDVFELILENPKTSEVKPCQFYNLGLEQQGNPILKRPISVSQVSEKGIHFVIKALGEGTKRLCRLQSGDTVLAVGPLGNGFETENQLKGSRVILIGGGIGTAPLLELAKQAKAAGREVLTILGYQREIYLEEEFAKFSDRLILSTMETPVGSNDLNAIGAEFHIGHTISAVQANLQIFEQDTIVACGPDIMLEKAMEAFGEMTGNIYLVTEERMACGMGACLVCAKKVVQNSEEKMVRTCIEGPVFLGSEVRF